VIRTPRLAAAVSAAAAGGAWRWLEQLPAPQREPWLRRNYADREVSLLLGPAVAAGAITGLAVAVPGPRRGPLLAVTSAALVGGYDDRYGDSHARGLGGHLRALADGEVTTGLVKLVTMTGTAALAARIQRRSLVDVGLGTVLVAGSANLINLFDLRPGRAAKVALLAAGMLRRTGDPAARSAAAVAGGAALAALPVDARERAMLGDCGAGTLGAVLGASLAMRRSRATRAVAAAGIVALTLASERVSFSAVIEANPILRALDSLGRPAHGTARG
jgi:UDP-N-acetylmuramyl pentapeptide phosphotransferase/UDP-N-acetylglucosamine-1-phosphate transferase